MFTNVRSAGVKSRKMEAAHKCNAEFACKNGVGYAVLILIPGFIKSKWVRFFFVL
jgi:hypothetical protein